MSSDDHPALAIICCVDNPAKAAAVEAAPRVEWAENSPRLTPLASRICLIHRAIVEEAIGL